MKIKDQIETSTKEDAGKIRLATAEDLIYRAYSQPYDGNESAQVLQLFASGGYPDRPRTIFFQATYGDANRYELKEHVPSIVYNLANYVATSYSSGLGLPELQKHVTIVDAYGAHKIPIESIS